MFKTYDLCNSCAYVNRIWACLIWLHVVIVESTKLPSDALRLLSWWPWGANPIVSRQDLVDDGGSWEHDDINWDDGNMLCFSCLKHHLCHMSWCFQICAFIFKRIWWWSQLMIYKYIIYIYIYIHVASRRQPPAPHRWAHTNMMMKRHVGHWDQKHPKVLIVGKKNAKDLIAMYSGPTQFNK